MWRVEQQREGNNAWSWRVCDGDAGTLSFGEILALLQDNERFVEVWSTALARCSFAAYCWECPPLHPQALRRPFECRLIESPLLGQSVPDPTPFADHFRSGADVAVFPSLGKDATLIAPCPRTGRDFTHLAQFQRNADAAQIRALWQQVGRRARAAADDAPVWLSTAGLGVAWLHLRLDTRPKYYRHAPYRDAGFLAG